MYRLIFLVFIAAIGGFYHYVSRPQLREYPNAITSLDSVCKSINKEVKNINYGGCGYFAYYLSDLLDSVDIRYEIRIINLQFDKTRITHVLIYLPDYNLFIDSTGMHNGIKIKNNRFFYCFNTGTVYDKAKLRRVISSYKWNKDFNLHDTSVLKYRLRLNKPS